MKIRLGFVSNSSSASFIVDLEEYPNVFSVAKEMLELTIADLGFSLKKDDAEYAQVELELLEQAIQDGIDPELPIFIPGNYDTCIVKKEDRYDINTNFDHPFGSLIGFNDVDYFGYMSNPNMEYYFLYLGKYATLKDYNTKYSELVDEKHWEIRNIVQKRKERKNSKDLDKLD